MFPTLVVGAVTLVSILACGGATEPPGEKADALMLCTAVIDSDESDAATDAAIAAAAVTTPWGKETATKLQEGDELNDDGLKALSKKIEETGADSLNCILVAALAEAFDELENIDD